MLINFGKSWTFIVLFVPDIYTGDISPFILSPWSNVNVALESLRFLDFSWNVISLSGTLRPKEK